MMRGGVAAMVMAACWLCPPSIAEAKESSAAARHRGAPVVGPSRSALLVEQETGRVLFEHEARRPWPPASMVKLMTALVAFDAVREGRARLDQPVRIGPNAVRTIGSRVYLRAGEVFPLHDLLGAMLVASANDASVAVAEAVAGSIEEMVQRMNVRARELGMSDTVYRSVHGLPPRRGEPADVTTAHDIALLARRIAADHEILNLSSRRDFHFRRGVLRNTNHLVGRVDGVDGLKTGYYRVAGFNLAATASRENMRLVSVVLGCPTLRCRFAVAEDLLEWGFTHYSRMDLIRAGEPLSVEIQVAGGTDPAFRPVAAETSTWLLRTDEARDLQVRFQVPSVVTAPVAKDQPLGEIIIQDGEGILDVIPAIAPRAVDRSVTAPVQSISY